MLLTVVRHWNIVGGGDSAQGELNLPNLTGTLGNNAFKGCVKLTSVASLGSITSIGSSAFENCTQLANINFPSTVTSVGTSAFNNTAWYNSQPDGPVIINGCVLYAYKGDIIGSYVVQNSILYITDWALVSKSSLTSITLGSGVNYVMNGAFRYDNNLSTIVVDSNNVKYDSRDNCNAVIETASNTLIAGCKNTIIPNTITRINNNACAYLSNLTSIVVPDSVTRIGENAFGRGGMINAVIGTGITSLGRQVFYADPLQTLTIKAITPPHCDHADTLPNNCIIYVPSESVDAYKTANIWKDHASQIQAIPT